MQQCITWGSGLSGMPAIPVTFIPLPAPPPTQGLALFLEPWAGVGIETEALASKEFVATTRTGTASCESL